MIQWLIIIGLVVIPFAHLEHVADQTQLKQNIALGLCLSIVFYALYTKGIKFVGNKWLLFLFAAMLVSTFFVPPSGVVIGIVKGVNHLVFSNINIENLWNFQPLFYGLLYLLTICVIADADLDNILIIKIIAWTGLLMALVVIAQKFGFQQFWRIQTIGVGSELGGMRNPQLMGFMAQYTLVSAFIALCQVSALFIRKYWMAIIMGVAIFIAGSHFAMLCVVLAWGLWIFRNKPRMMYALIGFLVFSFFVIFHNQNNGRFECWRQIIHDMTHPLYDNPVAESQGFTGYGTNAFHVLFPIMHLSQWTRAHNEFLEFMFNTGILGFGMLMASIFIFFRQCKDFFHLDTIKFCMFTFIIICILANGTFIWQLGWGQFYTVVIVGLAYSAIRKGTYVEQTI